MQTPSASFNNQKAVLFRILIIAIIAAGIVLRAFKYLPGWSMRGDELAVTLNLLNRSALTLATKPLEYEQAAPFGFLLVVKALLTLLGPSEYVLRLVAFVSSCISLVLIYRLLTKTSGPYGTVFALLTFASGYYLIYYSSELKQYSSDVLVCLILVLLFHKHISRRNRQKRFLATWNRRFFGIVFLSPRNLCPDRHWTDIIHPTIGATIKSCRGSLSLAPVWAGIS